MIQYKIMIFKMFEERSTLLAKTVKRKYTAIFFNKYYFQLDSKKASASLHENRIFSYNIAV